MSHRIISVAIQYLTFLAIAGTLLSCGNSITSAQPTATTATTSAAGTRPASPSPTTATATVASAAPTGPVKISDGGTVGKVLVDSAGLTLYTFAADAPGSGKSACNGGCATAWPPATAAAISEKLDGADSSFSLIIRDDGSKQIAYGGRPLYRFSGDRAPGEVKGNGVNGFGAVWTAATPKGAPAPAPASASPAGPSEPGY